MSAGRAPRRDGVRYPVKSASVSEEGTSVFLEIEGLKASHLIYVRLLPPMYSQEGDRPWSTEAWYTMNLLPDGRPGEVRPRAEGKPQNVLTDAEKAEGWRLLFDGRTLEGWHGYGKPGEAPQGWSIMDGCLVRTGSGGDIATNDVFQNFELALEWRISAGGNSGIMFHVDESKGAAYATGPEMQVLDNAEHHDGQNTSTSAGANYALHAASQDVTKPVGYFNKVRIVVQGPHVEHWLNGEKIVEYELGSDDWKQRVAASKFASMPHYGTAGRGLIVLQDHGDMVWYRNIKVREK
jgi:cytochrome c